MPFRIEVAIQGRPLRRPAAHLFFGKQTGVLRSFCGNLVASINWGISTMGFRLDISKQLLGSYFHQDFLDEFGSEQAAFVAIRDHECASLPAVTEELRSLLESRIDERQLSELLFSEIGVYFDPMSRGCTSRQWIEHAIAELNRSE